MRMTTPNKPVGTILSRLSIANVVGGFLVATAIGLAFEYFAVHTWIALHFSALLMGGGR
jgi:hypothetical protein